MRECDSNAQLVSLFARRFGAGQWSFLGPGSEKWYSISEHSPQGEWDKMAEKMMVTLAESGHPVFRATSPLSRGQLKSKGGGKLSIHYCADQDTITTVFRTITYVNQLSLYGAVVEVCEEHETLQDKKFFISELFKVIQDAILMILLCRTMLLFRTVSSSTFITSDVQSIYIPSSIRD